MIEIASVIDQLGEEPIELRQCGWVMVLLKKIEDEYIISANASPFTFRPTQIYQVSSSRLFLSKVNEISDTVNQYFDKLQGLDKKFTELMMSLQPKKSDVPRLPQAFRLDMALGYSNFATVFCDKKNYIYYSNCGEDVQFWISVDGETNGKILSMFNLWKETCRELFEYLESAGFRRTGESLV